jgi:hypothetical protein
MKSSPAQSSQAVIDENGRQDSIDELLHRVNNL